MISITGFNELSKHIKMDNLQPATTTWPTNGAVLDWFRESNFDTNSVVNAFCIQFKLELDQSTRSGQYLMVKLRRLNLKSQKKRNEERARFLEETFEISSSVSTSSGSGGSGSSSGSGNSANLSSDENALAKENKLLKRQLQSLEELKSQNAIQKDCLVEMSKSVREMILEKRVNEADISSLKQEVIKHTTQNASIEAMMNETPMEKKNKLLNKKLKYRDKQLANAKIKLSTIQEDSKSLLGDKKKLQKEKNNLRKETESLSLKLASTNSKHGNLKRVKNRLMKRVSDIHDRLDLSDEKDINDLEKQCEALTAEVSQLRSENKDLEQLVAVLEDDGVVTFADGRFTDEIREVIMNLVALGVSINKVNDVIHVVMRTLANKKVDQIRLPSDGTKKQIMEEARILAQIQVAEEMLTEGDGVMGNVLHGDGTTKYHRKYQNFQVTTKDNKTLSFGLGEMACGDAASTLQEFTSMVDEITASIAKESDKEITFAKLMESINSTMSDQGPINPIFNAQLKVMRENLLPTAIENWDTLTSSEQDELKKMGNFFCKLHLLANFGTETDSYLKEFEQLSLHEEYETNFAFTSSKECGAFRLIRTTCKAYHKRGCDKSGVGDHFESFLQSRGVKCHLASFVGNRFNIVYHNAAAIYYHRDALKDFYHAWPNQNNLLSAVNEDLNNKLFLAETRALGMIDKIVTGPFWRIVENVDNIFSINPYIKKMNSVLNDWSQDANPLFKGTEMFVKEPGLDYDEDLVHKDVLYEELFRDSGDAEFDVMTIQALEHICHGIMIIVERQASEHLVGGEHSLPSDHEKVKYSNVPAHNKASESDFAILDLLIRMKPRANIETLEMITMWYRNKTGDWLHEKSSEEREKLMKDATERSAKAKERLKLKKSQLEKRKLEILVEKQGEKREVELKKATRQTDAVNKLVDLGVRAWITEDEAEHEMKLIETSKDAKVVVLAQISYYKEIILFGKKLKREYFTKSKDGVELGVTDLFDKLKVLIRITRTGDSTPVSKPILKSSEERGKLVEEQKAKLKSSLFEVRLKNMMSQKKKDILPKLIANPDLLVNRRIKHFLRENKEDECIWTNGLVHKVEKYVPDTDKHVFEVSYEETPGDRFLFPLLQDMKKNEMFLLDNIRDVIENEEV